MSGERERDIARNIAAKATVKAIKLGVGLTRFKMMDIIEAAIIDAFVALRGPRAEGGRDGG